MKNNTNVITVSPNVTGNVGSCSVQSNTVTVSTTFWTDQDQVTQINSFTGQVISQSTYTDYSVLQLFGGIEVIILFVFLCIFIASSLDNY